MEIRKRKNIMIAVLCSVLILMGIGYAILSRVLVIKAGGKIKGNWDIYIESIEPYNIAGHAKSLENKIGTDKLSASIEAELNQPNDYVDYKVVVKNGGSIKAQLTNAALVQKKTNKYIEVKSTAISGTILSAGDTMNFIVTIKFKDVDTFETQDETMIALTELQLTFMQVETGSSDSTNSESNPITNEPKFTINGDGLITNYNYSYGTDVSIPAEVNGIPVKSIDVNSFLQTNIYVGEATNESTGAEKIFAVITDQKNKIMIEQALYEYACNDMYSDSGSDSASESTGVCDGMTSLADMGIAVYYSMDEASGALESYNITGNFEYIDTITKQIEENMKSQITKLDLSKATNLEEIGNDAFKGEKGVGDYGECGNQTTGICGKGLLESLILPTNGNLKIIGQGAFEYNKLTNITIPSSVTALGDYAFQGNKLTRVIIQGEATRFDSTWSNIFDSNVTRTVE